MIVLVPFDLDDFDARTAQRKADMAEVHAFIDRIAPWIDEPPFAPEKETPVPITGRRE